MKLCNRKLGLFNSKGYILYPALIASIIISLLIPHHALADQANPDTTPTANIYCYRNILETGDFGIFIYANIPYSSVPSTPVNEAFIWRVIDTDNSTELGATTGYVHVSSDSGYGYNVYWLYWSASEAPTWGGSYGVRLSGNPVIFTDPPIYNFTIGSSAYSSTADSDDVKTEIGDRIIETASDLDIRWDLSTSTSLIYELETATVLSLSGQTLFRGAIYGCQAIAPSVFRTQVKDINVTNRSFSSGYSSNVSSQYAGTWVATAQQGGADFFDTSFDLLSIIILGILCFGILYLNSKITSNLYSGLIDVAVLLVFAARLGLYEMAFICMIAAVFWIYSSAKIWGLVR